MGYRDDRDAAFERAEALATEAQRAQAASVEKDRQIHLLHAELAAARTRPPTPEELEDREEARRQGRRHVLRIITLIVGCLSLILSGLVTMALGVYIFAMTGNTRGYSQLVEYSNRPELFAAAQQVDAVALASQCGLTVALLILSIGMVGRTRWSAWGSLVWAILAIVGAAAFGVAGHVLLGPMAWANAAMAAIPPLFFGIYAWVRVRYELR